MIRQEEEKQIKEYLISVKLSDIQLKWLPIQEYEANLPGKVSGELLAVPHNQDVNRREK